MRLAGEWISTTLFNLLHHMTNLDSLSQSVFYPKHHDTRWCNPSTTNSHKSFPSFNTYEKHFMHDIISSASFMSLFNVDETLKSLYFCSSLILCHSFHIFFELICHSPSGNLYLLTELSKPSLLATQTCTKTPKKETKKFLDGL
jgi:hypothetical protein